MNSEGHLRQNYLLQNKPQVTPNYIEDSMNIKELNTKKRNAK